MNLLNKKFYFILLTIITSLLTINYLENTEINKVSNIIIKRIYNPKVEIEDNHYFNHDDDRFINKALTKIIFNNPYIQSIKYINNNYFNSSSKKNILIPNETKNILLKKRSTYLIKQTNNKDIFSYIFRFGTGYYQINYYFSALKAALHSNITINRISDIYDFNHNNKRLLSSKYKNLNSVGLVIESGFILKKLIIFITLCTLFSSILAIGLVKLFITLFNEKNIMYRSIKNGVKKNQFIPYYQQIYSFKKNKFISAEVLCRWNKNNTIIPPYKFISELENHEEINDVTFHLMKTAFMDLEKSTNKNLLLSFNFTVKMMMNDDFIKKVIVFIENTPNVKNKIIIELTESDSRFIHTDKLKESMLELKRHGVLLSIDDFGTGYSNLYTIQELPFDIMKIDRAFISNQYAVSNSNMLEMMVNLGKSMHLSIVAEGVETEDELLRVKNLDIDYCQGFYYSKPCDSSNFIAGNVK